MSQVLKSLTVTQAEPSDGSTMTVGQPTIPTDRREPDQVMAIASRMSCKRLSAIKQGTLNADQMDYRLLTSLTAKAGKQDYAYWTGRLLAHFPRRDATKDAIVISDLGRLLEEIDASAVAVCQVCEDLLKESTVDNPFMPPTGEIIERVKLRMWFFEKIKESVCQK